MSGNDSPLSDEINWEAYSHEELHRMLWQDADVADVSTVATEWTRHRAALDTHAEVLREQRTALLGSWHGVAAEEAAARLAALAERIEKISELATAGQQAAQNAADALATARAAMPPPPAGAAPFALPAAPAFPGLPTVPSMPATFTPGFSFYFGVAAADQQKAQAVRAMQTYESSLNGSGRLIDDARGTVPQAAASPARAVTPAGSRGVPWRSLAGSGPVPTPRGPVIGTQAPLTPGMRAAVVSTPTGGPIGVAGPLTSDTGARSAGQNGVLAPPASGARGDDDQPHENQLPTLDHGLFEVDERVAPAVIGEET